MDRCPIKLVKPYAVVQFLGWGYTEQIAGKNFTNKCVAISNSKLLCKNSATSANCDYDLLSKSSFRYHWQVTISPANTHACRSPSRMGSTPLQNYKRRRWAHDIKNFFFTMLLIFLYIFVFRYIFGRREGRSVSWFCWIWVLHGYSLKLQLHKRQLHHRKYGGLNKSRGSSVCWGYDNQRR